MSLRFLSYGSFVLTLQEVCICVSFFARIRIQFESLLDRAIVGDPTVESLTNDILSNFDTLLPLLKALRDQISR